ncbi:ExbD/TolR family protein [Reinekea marinisedimentorum]|uniref:Biopolymer transport protein ExbD n=1 Tax=Reinekea marinisedimentorum TaxID=230495 RepID=A0A4R3HTR9_9GAMM|nr:biopolymer transporter ExbD [Reinekea marinisedimentorum]TCS36408.1 biopolymer transport protein ExbD [Reinekea marinisedimentorum]
MLLNLPAKPSRKAISLTPLIDVVFILLLFFMLSSSFVTYRQLPVPLPDASPNAGPVLLSVQVETGGSAITVAGKTVSIEQGAALQSLVAVQPDAVYLVSVTDAVTTQQLVKVMDALTHAGAEHVSLQGLE